MWFDVPYKKGKIEVVAYDENGQEAARETIRTAGKPHHLEAEVTNLKEFPYQYYYVTVKVVDKQGNLCPDADHLIHYHGTGFRAAANGDPACLDGFQEWEMHAFHGQCTFIMHRDGVGQFEAEGLKSAVYNVWGE